MNRRDFLKRIIAVPLAVKATSEFSFPDRMCLPNGSTIAFGSCESGWEYCGIPFYENVATYRHDYMGISRELWSKALELPIPENITQKLQDE